MNIVLKGVLEEELERNLQKQRVFLNELSKYDKGSLQIIVIKNNKYIYRKYRNGNKVFSVYVGLVGSKEAENALMNRKKYLKLKEDLRDLKNEERELRDIIKKYDRV